MSKLLISVRCCFRFGCTFSSKANDFVYSLEQNLIRPAFKANTVPASVLALNLQNDLISLLQMRSSLEVTRWECRSLFEGQKSRRLDTVHIQEAVYNIVKTLPKAELYLMEDIPLVMGQISKVSTVISQVRIETTLVTLLNHLSLPHDDNHKAFESHVYRLKPSQISRFFEVYISGQRTQCSPIVQSIIEGRCEVAKGVYVPYLPAETFRQMENAKSREQMAYCLLQAVFFYKQLEKSGRQSLKLHSPAVAHEKIVPEEEIVRQS